MNIKKIFSYLPSYPHYKMNVFSGTNNFNEIKRICKNLYSGELLEGKLISIYENKLQKKFSSKKIYTFAAGRMGLYTILKTLNIKPGEEVIIPSYTCVVVPNAILYAGARPIYCDINKKDFNIDLSKLEALITHKTRVLYAQHTFGQMCDIEAIVRLAKKHNLVVVEDATLSLGAKIHDQYAGTIGDFGYYSSDRSKIINTGIGGIVSVNNDDYREIFKQTYSEIPHLDEKFVKKLVFTFIINIVALHPSFYWIGKFFNVVLYKLKFISYLSDEKYTNIQQIKNYPYPARLPNILSSIGISQIEELDTNLLNRKKIAKYYNDILRLYTDQYLNDDKNIFLRYSFLIRNRDYWEKRFSSKIDLFIWFKTVIAGKMDDLDEIYYQINSNIESEYVCEHIFNLPTHNNIRPEKLQQLLIELKQSGDIITRENIL